MRIYFKKKSAKFHPDSTWNNGALGFLNRSPNNNNKQQQQKQQDE